jgi:hypothetical protein
MASLRADQIAQQIPTLGEVEPAALLRCRVRQLTAGFQSMFRSSNL